MRLFVERVYLSDVESHDKLLITTNNSKVCGLNIYVNLCRFNDRECIISNGDEYEMEQLLNEINIICGTVNKNHTQFSSQKLTCDVTLLGVQWRPFIARFIIANIL